MLTEEITLSEIRKIFDNRERKAEYIRRLYNILGINEALPRNLDNAIIETWNYDISKAILREMFFVQKSLLIVAIAKKK